MRDGEFAGIAKTFVKLLPLFPMKTLHLVASGDLRLAANQTCWAAQKDMEDRLAAALKAEGWNLRRAHPYDRVKNMVSSTPKRWVSRCSGALIPTPP